MTWKCEAATVAILTQQVSHYHVPRYRACADRFERVTVLSAMNDAEFDEFLATEVEGLQIVRLFEGREDYLRAVPSGTVAARTAQALEAIRPDVVAVAGWSCPESFGAMLWAKRNGVPIVLMAESQENDGRRSSLRESIKRRAVGIADAALVGGRRQLDYMAKLGMPPRRTFLGYAAVDNRHFAEGAAVARANSQRRRAELGLPEHYLLASSRFIEKKNLPRLVDAFGTASKVSGSSHSLVILGDGPGRAKLLERAAFQGVGERVLLPGFRPYSELPAFYGLADGFVHVALADQWALVINEAASAALPIVASEACGASAELVQDGLNGFVVNAPDSRSIADALVKLMSAGDPERRSMGVESARIVSDWGPERFAGGMVSACAAATEVGRRRLLPWDAFVLNRLARRYFETVS